MPCYWINFQFILEASYTISFLHHNIHNSENSKIINRSLDIMSVLSVLSQHQGI
jgi:hypothetical protein